MVIIEWGLLLTLGILVGWSVYKTIKLNQTRQRLDEAFYRVLETQNSCISLIQLAAIARVDADSARQYLTDQVQSFGAIPETDADGNTFYRFPSLRRFESLRGR
jgi:hypothetical protein